MQSSHSWEIKNHFLPPPNGASIGLHGRVWGPGFGYTDCGGLPLSFGELSRQDRHSTHHVETRRYADTLQAVSRVPAHGNDMGW
jgi:hypothetical protein